MTSGGVPSTWKLVDTFKYSQNLKRNIYLRLKGVSEIQGYTWDPRIYLRYGGILRTQKIASSFKYAQNIKHDVYLTSVIISRT